MEQIVINFIFGGFLVVIGWVLKVIWDSIISLQAKDSERKDQVHNLSLLVVGDYVKQERFDSFATMISEKLDRIEKSLSYELGARDRPD